jgi:uncharacterized Zn finger protein (UPF0148 family)
MAKKTVVTCPGCGRPFSSEQGIKGCPFCATLTHVNNGRAEPLRILKGILKRRRRRTVSRVASGSP